jgi:SAM-dependent methyltransferase
MSLDLDFARCPVCRRGSLVSDGRALLQCDSCHRSFGCKDDIPILVPDWERHEAELEQARASLPGWYVEVQAPETVSPYRHHLARRRRYVEAVLARRASETGGPAGRLLDLGCGDGNHLSWLKTHAARIYGSDYNITRLLRARQRAPEASLFLADILDYPSHDDVFDVVFFNHVLEHIPDDAKALASVQRILKPGGLLVLGVPNEGAWWWQWAYRRAPNVRANTDHVNFYTGDSLAGKVTAAGLAVKQVEHLGWGPPDFEWDMRLRQYKLFESIFEAVGRVVLPTQSAALYLTATKPA